MPQRTQTAIRPMSPSPPKVLTRPKIDPTISSPIKGTDAEPGHRICKTTPSAINAIPASVRLRIQPTAFSNISSPLK